MNSSLLAGLGVGTGVVLAAGITASVIFPPPTVDAPLAQPAERVEEPAAPEPAPLAEAPPAETAEPPATEEALAEELAPEDALTEDTRAEDGTGEDVVEEPVADAMPEDEMPPALAEAAEEPSVEEADRLAETPASPEIRQTEVRVPDDPETQSVTNGDAVPVAPSEQDRTEVTRLPAAPRAPVQPDDRPPLPQIAPPRLLPETQDTPSDAPEAAPDLAEIAQQERQTMPGLSATGLPQIGAPADLPETSDELPEADTIRPGALARNALYDGSSREGPRMALVLGDPGLPTPMRVALAAHEIPFTVALNPFDSSAMQGAEIYRDAGKEVLILATSLPDGATASDLDVTFSAYFEALPQAVGVIDLPDNGFSRNSGMLNNIIPLLAQDGHGLLTFSGGLAQAGRIAQAADVAHAEVFRVLDRSDESPFTIRRFLDRAMFQASQIGEVIVFGDASNDATMEALEMWLDDGRADQIALVPISAILMASDE